MRRNNSTTQRSIISASLFFFVFCLTASFVVAQTSNTGTLTGVVKDEKGAVVPGATVKLINIGTNAERTTTTSEEGVL